MHVQPDYETEDILAVFDNPGRAREAVRRLREELGDPHKVVGVPLKPGRYQAADFAAVQVVRGAAHGVVAGLPIGALAGLGLASAVPGVGPFVLLGMAAAGAFGGLVLGGFTGAITRTRWGRLPAEVVSPV
jgi:hypothetical protein